MPRMREKTPWLPAVTFAGMVFPIPLQFDSYDKVLYYYSWSRVHHITRVHNLINTL